MSIPTGGGAGGFAKGSGPGSAADAAKSAAPSVGDAVNASSKGAGKDLAKNAGSEGGAGGSSAGQALNALSKSPAAAALPGGVVGQAVARHAVEKMGAGGTSPEGDPDENSGTVGKMDGTTKAAAAAAAVPVAGAVGQLMFMLMILNWLKTMFFAFLAMMMNLLSSILAVLFTVAKFFLGGAMAMGTAVSSFVGGAISVGTAAVASVATTFLVVSVSVVSLVTGTGNDTAQKDGALFDCSVDVVAAAESSGDGVPEDTSAKTLANAQIIYGVLSAWGMSDENVAGILGNWDMESGIDPTGVETITGEPFSVGPKKKEAESNGFDVEKIDPDYADRFPGVDLVGIGLGQWSNGRNTQLREYAKGSGNWASLETQLGFMISKDSGAQVIKNMISTPAGSPSAAAIHFHNHWELSADTSTAAREAAAVKWFARMGGWSKNQSLADSILAQSGSTLDDANVNRVSTAKENCLTGAGKAKLAGLKEGGLDLEEAEALMATYKSEGESVLVAAFGAGGPGDCGFGKSDNCVGFSSYFMHKFTSFKQYAAGNGIDTAASIAKMTDRETSGTPSPYSVFSMKTGAPEGHTGVILGIEGDQAIIGEASCGSNHAGTRAFTRPVSELTNGDYVFTDVSDLLTDEAMA